MKGAEPGWIRGAPGRVQPGVNPPVVPAAGLPDDLPLPTTAGPAPATGAPLRLRLRGPAELIAAVPHLLGFVPTDSLVLVAMRAEGNRTQLGAVVRIDLPEPDEAVAAVAACARRMGRREPEEVAAVVVGGEAGGGGPPRADVVEAVEELFAAVRVPVRSRLWVPRIVEGVGWRCYPPCDCSGVLPDPVGSTAALASTMLGQVTFASRGELERLVRADPEASGMRRRRLLDRAHESAALDRDLAGTAAARRDLVAVRRAVAEIGQGGTLGDAEIARLAVALCDPRVRDACMAFSLGGPGIAPSAAEALWTLLVRAVPAPEVAEPATLLACAALVRGGGALVGSALTRAHEADPGHTLSRLVTGLLDAGISHAEFLEWVRRGASDAEGGLLGRSA